MLPLDINWALVVIACIFMVLDLITGFCALIDMRKQEHRNSKIAILITC